MPERKRGTAQWGWCLPISGGIRTQVGPSFSLLINTAGNARLCALGPCVRYKNNYAFVEDSGRSSDRVAWRTFARRNKIHGALNTKIPRCKTTPGDWLTKHQSTTGDTDPHSSWAWVRLRVGRCWATWPHWRWMR